jgi:hypothetical protein
MSLTGFHPLWDKILSQNLQAVADQECHLEGSSPYKSTAYRGAHCNKLSCTTCLHVDQMSAAQLPQGPYKACLKRIWRQLRLKGVISVKLARI